MVLTTDAQDQKHMKIKKRSGRILLEKDGLFLQNILEAFPYYVFDPRRGKNIMEMYNSKIL